MGTGTIVSGAWARRSIAWVKDDRLGRGVRRRRRSTRGRLTAAGIAIGSPPVAYRLDYKLETARATSSRQAFMVDRARRGLEPRASTCGGTGRAGGPRRTRARGTVDLPAPGGDMAAFKSALDCDLALSPLTNSMPVLRHGLLAGGGPVDFVMAWVSVPDLRVHREPAALHVRAGATATSSIVRYESGSRDFVAELVFDSDGLVISYPGIGHRVS